MPPPGWTQLKPPSFSFEISTEFSPDKVQCKTQNPEIISVILVTPVPITKHATGKYQISPQSQHIRTYKNGQVKVKNVLGRGVQT